MNDTANKFNSNKKRSPGFRFAWAGLAHFFRTQFNARIHATIAIMVIIVGTWTGLALYEWILVVLCIGMVFSAELFNTAIELLTDIVSPDYHEKAGRVKDVAAAGVLIAAIAAAITGILIFLPKLVAVIGGTWGGSY